MQRECLREVDLLLVQQCSPRECLCVQRGHPSTLSAEPCHRFDGLCDLLDCRVRGGDKVLQHGDHRIGCGIWWQHGASKGIGGFGPRSMLALCRKQNHMNLGWCPHLAMQCQ